MGTYSTYSSSPPRGKWSSSAKRRTRRIKEYGGKTAGDAGTKRAGRMEGRMQQMRKHRAARRSARKSAHQYRPAQVAAKREAMKTSQRTERRSLYRRHSAIGRREAGYASRTLPRPSPRRGEPRPTLRQRAQRPVPRGRYERAGTPRGRDPNRPRGLYGGQQGYGRGTSRGDQLRQILQGN